jgi:DNA-binding Lrp family transcriptional regulator
MHCVFVQLRCQPGKTYEVADAIYEREIVSELYSTSGEYDLLAKIYVPKDADVGHFINERLLGIPGITRSLTTMTFKAF